MALEVRIASFAHTKNMPFYQAVEYLELVRNRYGEHAMLFELHLSAAMNHKEAEMRNGRRK